MRLVTRKIHRAFPELDRFSDEQCDRFVQAARGGRFARVARGVAMVLLALGLGWLLPTLALALFLKALGPSVLTPQVARDQGDIVGFTAFALFVLSPITLLLFRDVLLRIRIRRILRAHSVCTRCDYRLLGLRLDEHNAVVCPECGTRTRVDASLAALVAGDTTLMRRSVAEDLVKSWIMSPQAWRRTRRAALGVFLVFGVLPASVLGVWEYFIQRQASAATSQISTPRDVQSLADAVLAFDPPGPTLVVEEWVKRFSDASKTIDDSVFLKTITLPSGKEEQIDGRWRSPRPRRNSLPTDPDFLTIDETRRSLESQWISASRTAGLFDMLDELKRSPRLRSVVPQDPSVLGIASFSWAQLGGAWQLELARASVAAERKDDTVLVESTESLFAVARAARVKADMFDETQIRLAQVISLDALLSSMRDRPSTAIADGVDAMIARQWRDLPPELAFRGTQLSFRDQVAGYFSNPSAIRLGGWSPGLRNDFAWAYPGGKVPFWLGTLDDNLGDIDALFRVAAARQEREPYQRDTLPELSFDQSRLRPIARGVSTWLFGSPWSGVTVTGESPQDRLELRRRFVTVAAALARHHAATGRYPASLAELGPLLPQIPADPWSGKPLLYRAEGDSYTLYSVGFDGIDNGGVATPPQNGQPVAGLDIVAGQD